MQHILFLSTARYIGADMQNALSGPNEEAKVATKARTCVQDLRREEKKAR